MKIIMIFIILLFLFSCSKSERTPVVTQEAEITVKREVYYEADIKKEDEWLLENNSVGRIFTDNNGKDIVIGDISLKSFIKDTDVFSISRVEAFKDSIYISSGLGETKTITKHKTDENDIKSITYSQKRRDGEMNFPNRSDFLIRDTGSIAVVNNKKLSAARSVIYSFYVSELTLDLELIRRYGIENPRGLKGLDYLYADDKLLILASDETNDPKTQFAVYMYAKEGYIIWRVDKSINNLIVDNIVYGGEGTVYISGTKDKKVFVAKTTMYKGVEWMKSYNSGEDCRIRLSYMDRRGNLKVIYNDKNKLLSLTVHPEGDVAEYHHTEDVIGSNMIFNKENKQLYIVTQNQNNISTVYILDDMLSNMHSWRIKNAAPVPIGYHADTKIYLKLRDRVVSYDSKLRNIGDDLFISGEKDGIMATILY